MLKDVLWALGAALIVALAAYFGLFLWLGAHPWWQQSVALVGGAVGGVSAVLLRRVCSGRPFFVLIAAMLTLGAFGIAHFGKSRFAASFAEDAFAGQMWYFGWIAAAALATFTLALLPRR